jgi:hypothetical protein
MRGCMILMFLLVIALMIIVYTAHEVSCRTVAISDVAQRLSFQYRIFHLLAFKSLQTKLKHYIKVQLRVKVEIHTSF